MATAAGRHQPAQPAVRRQRRVHRPPTIRLPPSSRRHEFLGKVTTREHLHDRVTQISGQFTERSPHPLDPVFQRSQLRQAAILRRAFLPDTARLPTATQCAPAIQPGATVTQGDPRRIQALRAGAAVGDVLAAAAGRTTQGEAAAETRQARTIGARTRSLARPGNLAREQIEQLGFRQQEHLAAESEFEKRKHGRRVATATLQAAPAASGRALARASGSDQGGTHAHTECR